MALSIGGGQAVMHGNGRKTGIFDFDEQFSEPFGAVERHAAVWFGILPGGAQRVFEAVGEQRTQLGIGNGEGFRQLCIDLKADTGAFGLIRERGAQQVYGFVLAPALGCDGGDVGLHLADVRLSLIGLSGLEQGTQHGEVVAHIVLINGSLGLGTVQQRDMLFGGGELLAEGGLCGFQLAFFAQGAVIVQQQEIEQEHLHSRQIADEQPGGRGQAGKIHTDDCENIGIIEDGHDGEQREQAAVPDQ